MSNSSQSRKSEWIEGADWDLFERQYKEPYRINLTFFSWLEETQAIYKDKGDPILYIGAGMGANLYHVYQKLPGNNYLGIDLNPECVRRGNERLEHLGVKDCSLATADLYDLPDDYINRFNGIFSLATLSWLPDFETPAESILRLNPSWFAATSLFTETDVAATIKTSDYSRPIGDTPCTEKFYNVYSIPRVKRFFEKQGYPNFSFQRFEIDIDLPKPDHGGMGTYTERLADGRRIQISGPLLMSWYFILARR